MILPCLFLRLFLDVGDCYFILDDHLIDCDHIVVRGMERALHCICFPLWRNTMFSVVFFTWTSSHGKPSCRLNYFVNIVLVMIWTENNIFYYIFNINISVLESRICVCKLYKICAWASVFVYFCLLYWDYLYWMWVFIFHWKIYIHIHLFSYPHIKSG